MAASVRLPALSSPAARRIGSRTLLSTRIASPSCLPICRRKLFEPKSTAAYIVPSFSIVNIKCCPAAIPATVTRINDLLVTAHLSRCLHHLLASGLLGRGQCVAGALEQADRAVLGADGGDPEAGRNRNHGTPGL